MLAVSVRLVFWPILGYCKLELMLLSFSSGWQLRQREMFICLEFYIDMYWRNAEWSQSRPTLYGCLVCAYVTFFPFLLQLLAGEKGKSKELLWPESVFSLNLLCVYCSVAYFLLLLLLLSNCEPNLYVFRALLYVNLISKLKAITSCSSMFIFSDLHLDFECKIIAIFHRAHARRKYSPSSCYSKCS